MQYLLAGTCVITRVVWKFVNLIPAQRDSSPLAAGMPGGPRRDPKPAREEHRPARPHPVAQPPSGPAKEPAKKESAPEAPAAEEPALEIRSAQARRWSAELLREDVTCLVLYGVDGIGKSTLARQIAARLRGIRPVTVADDPEDIETALAAPGKVLITCRAPFETTRPGVIFRRVGPLTRTGAQEFALSLPKLCALTPPGRTRIWRLAAGHPGAMKRVDERLLTEPFSSVDARLSAAVSGITGWPADQIQPTELPPRLAESIANVVLELLRDGTPGEPPGSMRRHLELRRSAKRRLALAAAIALAITAVGFTAFRTQPAGSPHTASLSHPTGSSSRARDEAVRTRAMRDSAAWIVAQLAPGTKVSCDPAFCTALPRTIAEVPVADVHAAAIVVSTAKVRAEIGSRLTTLAPVILATFGTGDARIDVRLVAADSAADSAAAYQADRAQRRRAGELLLGNPDLSLSATARRQLADGEVDARLLITLAALVQAQPVSVLRFSDSGPGAAPDVPFRAALVSGPDTTITAFFRTQPGPFRPDVFTSNGKLLVRFSAPCPLGLLGDQP